MQAPESWFDVVPGLVPGYWRAPQGWQHASAGLHLSASGSLTGSLHALTRWLQTLLADGAPASVLAQLGAPRRLNQGQLSAYGLGLAQTRWAAAACSATAVPTPVTKPISCWRPIASSASLVANREDCDSFGMVLQVMAALLGEPLPQRSTAIPDGLYATLAEPHWLEVKDGNLAYLGSGEPLYQGETGTRCRCPPICQSN